MVDMESRTPPITALHALNLDCGLGRPPVAPERLLLAMLLRVVFHVADQEVPMLTASDRRWQMILGGLGETEAIFSQGGPYSTSAKRCARQI